MKIEWNNRKLVIDGQEYSIKEAYDAFPENRDEILKFIKETNPKMYKALLGIVQKSGFAARPQCKEKINETAEVAGKWWADKLRRGTVQNNGEDMQSMMMTLFAMMAPKSASYDEDVDDFEAILVELIDAELKGGRDVYLRVDYHPEGLLREAAVSADIDVDFKLPVKTSMRVSKETVVVSEGYGSPEKQIFPKLNPTKKK